MSLQVWSPIARRYVPAHEHERPCGECTAQRHCGEEECLDGVRVEVAPTYEDGTCDLCMCAGCNERPAVEILWGREEEQLCAGCAAEHEAGTAGGKAVA